MTSLWIIATAIQWIALLLLFSLVLGLARQLGQLAARLEAGGTTPVVVSTLLIGDSLPSVEIETGLPDLDLRNLVTSSRAGSVVLIVSEGCSSCGELIKELAMAVSPAGTVSIDKKLVIAQMGHEIRLSDTERAYLAAAGAVFVVDKHMRMTSQLGIRTVPSAMSFDSGGILLDQSASARAAWLFERLSSDRPRRAPAHRSGRRVVKVREELAK